MWTFLRRSKLVRTPREQQCHLLHNAPVAQDNTTPYSAGVERALRAALALDERTKSLEVIFKDGTTTDFDLILFQSTLEINNKWLDFKLSHSKTACWLSRRSDDELPRMGHFSCDHIVSTLYELVLEELMRQPRLEHRNFCESKASLYQKVCENLRQMPRMIQVDTGPLPGEIIVSWIDMEGEMVSKAYGLNPICQVTLHRESSCSLKRDDLIRPSM
jgi:hypothetical protein